MKRLGIWISSIAVVWAILVNSAIVFSYAVGAITSIMYLILVSFIFGRACMH